MRTSGERYVTVYETGDVIAGNEIIAEMATSSEEQTDGIAQGNVAAREMDRITRQSAALVE